MAFDPRQGLGPSHEDRLVRPQLIPGVYWDFFDHHIPLSDRNLCELLALTGFHIEHVEARFIPYTTRSALPQAPWLVALYLMLRPLSSALLGKQFLIVAKKPSVASDELL